MELPIKVNGVLIHNNKILLIKRKPEDGGFWQTVTGTLEEGETLKDTLVREIEEEVGIKENNIQEISDFVYRFNWDKKGWCQTDYVFAVLVDTDKVVLSHEHTDFVWLDPEEAIERVKTQGNKEAIKKVLEWLKGQE